jgi:hypothetical protein
MASEKSILTASAGRDHDSDSGCNSDAQANDEPTTITDKSFSTSGKGRTGATNLTRVQWAVIVSAG